MSREFFEMVLPNPPLPAVAGVSFVMLGSRDRAGEAGSRLPVLSIAGAAVRVTPDRDLFAETGRSGNLVRRFTGAMREKSEGTPGFWVGLAAPLVTLRLVGVDGL